MTASAAPVAPTDPRVLVMGRAERTASGELRFGEYLAETVRRVGDPRVRAVPSTHYRGEGDDAHPNAEQHEKMARDIEGPLRDATGWR